MHAVPEGTKVPCVLAGVVVACFADSLRATVVVRHEGSILALYLLYTYSILTLYLLYTYSILTRGQANSRSLYTHSILTLYLLYTYSILTLYLQANSRSLLLQERLERLQEQLGRLQTENAALRSRVADVGVAEKTGLNR